VLTVNLFFILLYPNQITYYFVDVRDRGAWGWFSTWNILGQIWNYSGTQFVNLGQDFWWRPLLETQIYIQEQLTSWTILSNLKREIWQLNLSYSGKGKIFGQILFVRQTAFVSNGCVLLCVLIGGCYGSSSLLFKLQYNVDERWSHSAK